MSTEFRRRSGQSPPTRLFSPLPRTTISLPGRHREWTPSTGCDRWFLTPESTAPLAELLPRNRHRDVQAQCDTARERELDDRWHVAGDADQDERDNGGE